MSTTTNDLEQGFPDDEDVPATTTLIGESIPRSLNQIDFQSLGCSCKHPIAAFFHVFFKVAALLCYWFLTIFTNNFVLVFVVCILLLVFDFWTVKNVSGRLLVGLRWWNEVQPDGTSEWKFESKEDRSDVDPVDSYFFWIALYAQPLVWVLMIVLCIVLRQSLQWLMVIGFALVLGCSNAIGYFKCQRDATSKLSGWFVRQNFVQSLVFKLLGR